jgi:hypothetical protein
MIRLRWYFAPLAVALLALLGASPSVAQGDPVGQCLDACDTTEESCVKACNNDVDCEDKCFDTAADCRDVCEASESEPGGDGDYEDEEAPSDDESGGEESEEDAPGDSD